MSAVTGIVIKTADIWLARRNKQAEEDTKAKSLTVEQQRAAIEARRVDDDADAKLIMALMEERKSYQEEIRALRTEIATERTRCDTEMERMRSEYGTLIAELRTEIRGLIGEIATVRATNAHLQQQMERLT